MEKMGMRPVKVYFNSFVSDAAKKLVPEFLFAGSNTFPDNLNL
jgi:hypothetical protein